MRRLLFALVPLALAADAGAQIMRRSGFPSPPSAFVSLGAALQNGFTVIDGSTGSRWAFGDATQYTASLEKALANGASLGLRGNVARVPLTYTQGTLKTDADALVSQGFTSLYLSNGRSFHSIFEGDLGATMYSNFTARGTNATLEPRSPDFDFSFAIGYGFGYSFSPRFAIDVVQTQTTTLHQKTGLAAGDDSSVRVSATRLVARFGLGGY